jgi:hypothetical protein
MNLSALGIDAKDVNFRAATMTSDRAICVRASGEGAAAGVAIVEIPTRRIASRRPLSAEAATLSPDGKLIAVRGA